MAENNPDRILKKDEYLEIMRRMNEGEPIPDDMKVNPERLKQAKKSYGRVKKEGKTKWELDREERIKNTPPRKPSIEGDLPVDEGESIVDREMRRLGIDDEPPVKRTGAGRLRLSVPDEPLPETGPVSRTDVQFDPTTKKGPPDVVEIRPQARLAYIEAFGKVAPNMQEYGAQNRTNLSIAIWSEISENQKNLAKSDVSRVTMQEIRDVRDYLYLNKYLEPDDRFPTTTTNSRITDKEIPIYLKPSQKAKRDPSLRILQKDGQSLIIGRDNYTETTPETKEDLERIREKGRKGFGIGLKGIGFGPVDAAIAAGVGAYSYLSGSSAAEAATEAGKSFLDISGSTPVADATLKRTPEEIARSNEEFREAKRLEDDYGVVLERGQTLSDVLTPSEIERAENANSFLNPK